MRKKVLCMLLIIAVVLQLWACSKADSEDAKEKATNNEEAALPGGAAAEGDSADVPGSDDVVLTESDIGTVAIPTADGNMCLFVTNNSSVAIDRLDVEILYKDENGSTTDMDSDGHDMILPDQTVVSKMSMPENFNDFVINTTPEVGTYDRYENHLEEIDVSANQGSDGIIIEITNNSDVSIDEIEYVVVLYLGDDIASVGFAHDVRDVAAGATITEKESTYGTEYDRFEVYINQAHTFGL